MNDLTQWVISELSSLLHFPVTEDMARCILMIESNRDLEEYMRTLVDYSNPLHQKFVKELLRKKPLSNSHGYKKSELDNYVDPSDKKDKKKGKNKNDKTEKKTNNQSSNQLEDHGKKKTKFVNLYASGDVVLLKGRHSCNCQASKHGLVNNCLKCGRIICEQEGSGPCIFCNRPVYSRQELQKNPQLSKLMQGDDPSLDSALNLKDRLLEYDKASEMRTRVIDDECDYFSTNSVWLSKEAREELRKKEEELQELKHSRARNLVLDFTGRRIIDDEFKKLNLESCLLEEVSDIMDSTASGGFLENDNLDPKSTFGLEPIFDGQSGGETGSKWHNRMGRVQDKQVMEMTDSGACLSLHQPWATLLVEGIKRDEGRSWYTAHRGRLWIAATARVPEKEEIEQILSIYRNIHGDEVRLPKKFPSGCLLGCVTLENCLAQEEYRTVRPEGEVDDPYVLLCSDPTVSPVLFPMKGKQKIYKLDKNIHQAAVKCLQKLGRI